MSNVHNSISADESNKPGRCDAKDDVAEFREKFIRSFPKSSKKVPITVSQFSLKTDNEGSHSVVSQLISPHGMEFQVPVAWREGTLLKVEIAIPDFWERKQRVVEYKRVDTPENFRLLAKVIKVEDVGKRGKKKLIVAQTVNLEPADEEVLKQFIQFG